MSRTAQQVVALADEARTIAGAASAAVDVEDHRANWPVEDDVADRPLVQIPKKTITMNDRKTAGRGIEMKIIE